VHAANAAANIFRSTCPSRVLVAHAALFIVGSLRIAVLLPVEKSFLRMGRHSHRVRYAQAH